MVSRDIARGGPEGVFHQDIPDLSLKTWRTGHRVGCDHTWSDAAGVSKASLVIIAVVIEGRSAAEVIAEYGVSRSWLYELLARYKIEGDAAFALLEALGRPTSSCSSRTWKSASSTPPPGSFSAN
ncbi:MAG: family transposase [Nocardioides sp.]|jgi:hypothetical protein|nr:family transposase [Nocardioides sp.]